MYIKCAIREHVSRHILFELSMVLAWCFTGCVGKSTHHSGFERQLD